MRKLWLLIIALLLALPCQARDENSDGVYEINDLSGGLATKLSDFSVPKDKGTVVENVRFSTKLKALSKRSNLNVYGTADASEPILGMHRFYKKDGSKILLVVHGNQIDKGNDNTGAFTKILDLT